MRAQVFSADRGNITACGSGFVLDAEGTIVTNAHVAAMADARRRLNVKTSDGAVFPATVLSADEQCDVALLRVDAGARPAKGFVPASIGRSADLVMGDAVVALGCPQVRAS